MVLFCLHIRLSRRRFPRFSQSHIRVARLVMNIHDCLANPEEAVTALLCYVIRNGRFLMTPLVLVLEVLVH